MVVCVPFGMAVPSERLARTVMVTGFVASSETEDAELDTVTVVVTTGVGGTGFVGVGLGSDGDFVEQPMARTRPHPARIA